MKHGRWEIGDRVTVYHQVREDVEVCDHGEKHRVPILMVKKLTITDVRSEFVKALNYVSDGFGDVLYATDAQGRTYRKQPHWDGPRASVWVRATNRYQQHCLTFSQYPTHKFSRDAFGRPLHL